MQQLVSCDCLSCRESEFEQDDEGFSANIGRTICRISRTLSLTFPMYIVRNKTYNAYDLRTFRVARVRPFEKTATTCRRCKNTNTCECKIDIFAVITVD